MSIRNSWPGPTGVTTQTDARLDLAGLIVRDVSGAPRGGIFPRHTNALVTARSDMKVDVAGFEGCSIRGNGPLFQSNDGTVQVTIATAPGSNSRLDVVYFKQNESASPYSDANDSPILASQSGVAAASPVLADTLALLPAGAEPLYSVLVPAGKTATNQSGVVITPIFRYTTVVGGMIWVRSAAELDVTSGYAAMNNYAAGTKAYDISTGISYRSTGTAWVRAEFSSLVIPTVSGSGVSVDSTGLVTFTSVTSVVVDAAFLAAHRKTKISLQSLNNSGTASMIFRTTAPADDTSSNYGSTSNLARNGVLASATGTTTSWVVVPVGSALAATEIEFVGAAAASPTTGFLKMGAHTNPAAQNTSNLFDALYLTQHESVAFGGFKIVFSAACSGTIRITGEI